MFTASYCLLYKEEFPCLTLLDFSYTDWFTSLSLSMSTLLKCAYNCICILYVIIQQRITSLRPAMDVVIVVLVI